METSILREALAWALIKAWNDKNGVETRPWWELSSREKEVGLYQAEAALEVMRQEMLK